MCECEWCVGHDGNRYHAVGTLERWRAHDDVIHFEWQQQVWLPIFQFYLTAMSPRVAVGLVLIEFAGVLPNWEIAQWFATPNSALDGNRPAEILGANPGLVIEAARHEKCLWAHLDA